MSRPPVERVTGPVVGAVASPVIGVVGGSGGVGSSTLAAALGAVAGVRWGAATLVDLDVGGGGIDVLLGLEDQPGARWSGLHLAGGRLDPDELRAGLPHTGELAVLAADVASLPADDVEQVLASAAARGPVVLDLPRPEGELRAAAVGCCDLVVVVARADVAGLVAAHTVVSGLLVSGSVASGLAPPVGLALRRGEIAAAQAAELVGRPVLGVLPPMGAGRPVDPLRPPRAVLQVVEGILAGVSPAGRRVRPPAAPHTVNDRALAIA